VGAGGHQVRRIGPLDQEIIGAWLMSSAELSEFEAWEVASND
jgi:hypothetical protein